MKKINNHRGSGYLASNWEYEELRQCLTSLTGLVMNNELEMRKVEV